MTFYWNQLNSRIGMDMWRKIEGRRSSFEWDKNDIMKFGRYYSFCAAYGENPNNSRLTHWVKNSITRIDKYISFICLWLTNKCLQHKVIFCSCSLIVRKNLTEKHKFWFSNQKVFHCCLFTSFQIFSSKMLLGKF